MPKIRMRPAGSGVVCLTGHSDLIPVIGALGPQAKEVIVTTAERLRAEGRTEGPTEGRAETVLELLTLKFGPLPDEVIEAG